MARHRRRPRRNARRMLAAVVLATVTTGGTAWAALELSPPGRQQPAATPEASPTPPVVSRCVRALEQGGEAVTAARAAVAGWAGHVEAEFDVDAGRISSAEANRIWDETTANSPSQISRFRAAAAHYHSLRPTCQQAAGAELPAKLQSALTECQDLAALTDQTLAAARAALTDWNAHLHDMAAGPGGMLDAPAAVPGIDRFYAAAHDYQRHARCALG
jgi:hypothetical protein